MLHPYKSKTKLPNQTKKNLLKYHQFNIVLITFCWAWGLSLRMVCFPNETSLRKTFFRLWVLINGDSFWVGDVGWANFLSQHWDLIRPTTVQTPCILSKSLRIHMYIGTAVPRRPFVLGVLHSLRPLQIIIIPPLHLQDSSRCEGEGFVGPFWAECSNVSHSLHIIQLWLSLYLPLKDWRELLWWWVNKTTLSMAMAECH